MGPDRWNIIGDPNDSAGIPTRIESGRCHRKPRPRAEWGPGLRSLERRGVMVEEGVLAWHWCRRDRRLGYTDRRAVYVGGVYDVDGPIMLCRRGLHACRTAMQALH